MIGIRKHIIICTAFLCSFNFYVFAQKTYTFPLYSKILNDTLDISVSNFDSPETQLRSVVYYLDANLESGKNIRKIITGRSSELKNVLFVGIANRGNTKHKYRKRDYIPPVLKGKDTLDNVKGRSSHFAHADVFYTFLTKELIPYIESGKQTAKRTLAGHSLGGLFVIYSLLKEQPSFDNFIALSPALWANKNNIFKYVEQFSKTEPVFNNYLFLSAGAGEKFNFILSGNRKLKATLNAQKYSGLTIDYKEWKRKGHDNQVPVSLQYLIDKKIFW